MKLLQVLIILLFVVLAGNVSKSLKVGHTSAGHNGGGMLLQ